MTMTIDSKDTIRLDNIVVQRKIPFNDEGATALRAIRSSLEDELTELYGKPISLPFPSAIHLILLDYAKLRGIDVRESLSSPES